MNQSFEQRTSITLTSNNLKIFGILHLPHIAQEQKVPAVLFCHGFGGNKSGKFRLSVRQSELLAQAGIASLRIDFRGSGDSEGDFADTTIETQLEDARIAANFVLEHPAIDQQRFGILGRSLGGAIATHLAQEIKFLRALALWCPVFDCKPWLAKYQGKESNISHFGQPLSKECIAQFTTLDAAKPLSTLTHVPLLIMQGGNDQTLGNYHFEQYLQHRKGIIATENVHLPLSDHEFSNIDEQQTLLQKTTSWFSKNL